MLKDLKLAREAAEATHAKTALGAHAADIYERYAAAGHSASDFSGIINFVREASKAS
jgi:3-hydroxyisobutyrate dehydrogenase